ncbi:MAG: serine/threonine protein kinase [Ktedonobacteraceae bacterium]
MNAETLVGKKLGSYTLRRVIGMGSMGAEYLARMSQSHQEYVLKVFLRASSLEPLQYIDFILRFRQEMESVVTLNHPHILSVLEFEERDGFVYLVMPYVRVRNLESALNSQKTLSLSEIADYLDQLAGALDYAHEHNVLHLDIKPSNVLISQDNNTLLLTDFALTKTMTERQAARIRQFKVGMLDYMSPELVMGKEPGEKADLYSLGAVLYYMVTGSAPFQGESMVEVAKKQLQESPPSPRSKRPELPPAAEQVILRALSKRPGHRYEKAQDLAAAFRLALETPSTELEQRSDTMLNSIATSSGVYPSYSLFDPQWRTELSPAKEGETALGKSTSARAVDISKTSTGVFVSIKNLPSPTKPEQAVDKSSNTLHAVHFNPITPAQDARMFPERSTNLGIAVTAVPVQDTWISPEQNFNPSGVLTAPPVQDMREYSEQNANPSGVLTAPPAEDTPLYPVQNNNPTGVMALSYAITPAQDTRVFPDQNSDPGGTTTVSDTEQSTTGTIMKLTSPAKVVNVPVAGQPGRYLVGLLPVPETSQPEKITHPPTQISSNFLKKNSKIIALVLLVVFLLGTGTLWFAHQHSTSITPAVTMKKTPDLKATMVAQATATAEANIILADPLSSNIHNWPLMSSGSMLYAFKDGAYHITDNDNNRGAPAILSGVILQGQFVYTLTMEEIKGDDTSVNNQFGMIFRANIQNKNGKTFTTFYTLEVLNTSGGQYQFWKYDDRQGPNSNLWVKLASHSFGSEFHEGHGSKNVNTFKIIANGKNFTLAVNRKKAWTFQDGTFASGGVGMLVNLKGTEVAFSNLLLTHN